MPNLTRLRRLVSLPLGVLLCVPALLSGQQTVATTHRVTPTYETFLTGSAVDVTTPTKGGLQLEGGGTDIPDAFSWLIDHSGGGDIVVIRASGADGYNPFIFKLGTVNSVQSILFKSRDAAFDTDVLNTLAHAEAVFIAGGDQSKYVTYWKDTPVQTTLEALAKRGVPIGGTSAGLAVLGQWGYSGMSASVTSKTALADPYSPEVTLERAFLSLPNMAGIITDSHVGPRDRLGRTLTFLARITTDGWAPTARGVAVDQESAVLVEADGTTRIVGKAPTYFLQTTKPAATCKAATALTIDGIATYRVPPGGTFNLKTWTGTGGDAYVLSVAAGVVSSSTGRIY